MDLPPVPRDMTTKLRIGTTKVKTGCVVCKIRRIKCDETKPACQKCTSTGRHCDGYGHAAPKRIKTHSKSRSRSPPTPKIHGDVEHSLTLYIPSMDIQAAPNVRRSFHYFRTRNMAHMPGTFEPYFWDRVVLQFSHQYSTVLQTLVALSAIYEERERRYWAFTTTTRVDRDEYALVQHNKAMNGLLKYLNGGEECDAKVALTSCLIFVWIELLQDNVDTGLRHLDSGLKILRDVRQTVTSTHDNDPEGILASLNRSFTRLRIQAAVHGSLSTDFTTSNTRELEVLTPIPISFSSILEARSVLDNELNAIFGYVRDLHDTGTYSTADSQTISGTQEVHLARLALCRTATEKLVSKMTVQDLEEQKDAIAYLRLYFIFMNIIWRTMFADTEMVFDTYIDDFDMMNTIIASLSKHSTSDDSRILSFDMGIIPPLFHILLKCRVRRIRTQAMSLLRRAPEREGMFHRDSIITYCSWKIEMEESWCDEVGDEEPLPEYARIHTEHIDVGNQPDRVGSAVRVSFKRGSSGLEVEDSMDIPGASELIRHMGNMI